MCLIFTHGNGEERKVLKSHLLTAHGFRVLNGAMDLFAPGAWEAEGWGYTSKQTD